MGWFKKLFSEKKKSEEAVMIEKLQSEIGLLKTEIRTMDRIDAQLIKSINLQAEQIANIRKTLHNVLNIAVDHEPSDYANSWAVVCLATKNPQVKFVHLNNNEAKHIIRFIKQFDDGNINVDSAPTLNSAFKF